MVPLRVLTLVMAGPAQPSILVLEPVEDSVRGTSRVLPIWIGPHEATQLGVAIEQVHLQRPTTHDLFLDALTNLDARIDHAAITEAQGQTFFAKLSVKQGDRLVKLDARPTDALSLAIRQQAPIYAEERVLEQASFPYLFKNRNSKTELEDFHSFIEHLSPEDFQS